MADLNLGKVRQTDAELEAKIQAVIENMGGVGSGGSSDGFFDILWTNSNPEGSFGQQQIVLNKPLSDYKYWMMIYCVFRSNTTGIYSLSNGLSRVGENSILSCIVPGNGILRRDVQYVNSTTLKFGDNYKYTSLTSTSSSITNTYNVPLEILGVK